MNKVELSKAIYKAISEIPTHNSGVIEMCPSTLRNHLSSNLIQKIADKAADVAMETERT